MNRLVFAHVLMVGLVLGLSASTTCAESKRGPIKFATGNESVNISLGAKLKLDATLKKIKVGAISAVAVGGNVRNPTADKIHYAYFVSFMDKDNNLIGCHHFNLWVDGNKTAMAGTFIQLPPDQIARIASYSVAFYEGPNPIGQ